MKWGLTHRNEKSGTNADSLQRDLDRVFDQFFSFRPTGLFDSDWLPQLDVQEDAKAITVKAEIPGIDEKDLNVTLDNNVLTIAGEKKLEKEEKDKRYTISERRFGSFSRSISLPEGVRPDRIKAAFKNGVLSVMIPRDESAQPKKITIDVH